MWLRSGKDFEAGKSLYLTYGTNSFFKSLLNNQGATPYNVKKLGADLKALAPAPPAIDKKAPRVYVPECNASISPEMVTVSPESVTETKEKGILPLPSPTGITSDYPKYLQLKEHLKNAYRQLERNRTELDLGTSQPILHLCAKQILSLHGKIQDIWKLIDYYDAEDRFPEVIAEIIRTPAEEIQLLRQSTSKAKKRLNSGTCRDIPATQDLITKNNKRIIELGGKVKS